jgi:hypothetical protein
VTWVQGQEATPDKPCSVFTSAPPPPINSWPLSLWEEDVDHNFKYVNFQLNHLKQETGPKDIAFAAEIDLQKDKFVLYLDNKGKYPGQSTDLKFYYTIDYKGYAPIYVDNSGFGGCFSTLKVATDQYPRKITLSQY